VNRTVLALVLSVALLAVPLATGASVSISNMTVAPGESVTITPDTGADAMALNISGIPTEWSVSASGGGSVKVETVGGTQIVRWLSPGDSTSMTLTVPERTATETITLTATVHDENSSIAPTERTVQITVEEPTPTESTGGLPGDGFDIGDDDPTATETTTDATDGARPTDEATSTVTATVDSTDELTTESPTENRPTPTIESGPGFGIVAAILSVALAVRRT